MTNVSRPYWGKTKILHITPICPMQGPPEPPRTWFPGAVSPSKPKASKVALPPPRYSGNLLIFREMKRCCFCYFERKSKQFSIKDPE